MDIVKGVFSTAGQFQIIIGQGTVNRVYAELASLAGIQEMSTADVKDAAMEKLNPFQRFCRMSVSYTHLDVYKRQILYCFKTKCSDKIKKVMQISFASLFL